MIPMKRDLHLNLQGQFFDEIKDGVKKFEYRKTTPYWAKRIEGRSFRNIVLRRGFPSDQDDDKHIVLPWRSVTIETIQDDFFGPDPVTVYAIQLTETPYSQIESKD